MGIPRDQFQNRGNKILRKIFEHQNKHDIGNNVRQEQHGAEQFGAEVPLGNVKGKHGHIYAPRDGVCFEPQYFPDAVNRPEFESSVCEAGQKFDKKIKYVFFNDKYC